MHRSLIIFVIILLAVAIANAADTSKPVTGFDATALDRTIDPCTDFYRFSCGGWLQSNPIPADQTRWGRFDDLYERNRTIVREILEQASVNEPNRSSNDQKIGDYYASCMDVSAIEAKGLEPIKTQLDSIDGLKSKRDLARTLAVLQRGNVDAFFGLGSQADAKNASQMILAIGAGGLGLPDRDYYLRDDAKSVELRKQYVQHVENMLRLAGTPADKAAIQAKAILQIETALAKSTLDVVARRAPASMYHKRPITGLNELAPGIAWSEYFATVHGPQVTELNITEPEFFKGLNEVIDRTDLDTIKAYLRWQLVSAAAPTLPQRFYDERFEFYGKALRGAKEQQARWKRCSSYTDSQLGEAVGQAYVARAFGPDSKARAQKIVAGIEEAMRSNLAQIGWMSDETKKQAYAKLEALGNKIGYPDKWRDYSKLTIVRGDAVGNLFRASEFDFDRRLARVGRPVDRMEWAMSPPTVNAYYQPLMNNINFPAGILQPPFFDRDRDETYNYGGIGAVIGHELTHGFDDEGRQYDRDGNLRDWWTKADNDEFNKRAECFVQQYGDYPVVDEVKLNGKLTLGENVADGGGLRLAMMAALASLTDDDKGLVDGYTPEQRVFLGFGQIWCTNATPQSERMQALTDPHSLPRWRVNGTVSNLPEFQKAWGCKPNAPMVRQNACHVW